jgi:hypothetical protein
MAKAQAKEIQIRPVKLNIIIDCHPDTFFESNPTLKNAVLYNNEPVFPLADEGTNTRLAFYAVLLSWYDSPLFSEPSINTRKRKAATIARIPDVANTELEPREKFEVELLKGSQAYTYFDNFLTYQRDFHHKYCVHFELVENSLFEYIQKSFNEPLKTDVGEIEGMVSRDLPNFLKEFRAMKDDLPNIRASNFAMMDIKQRIYDSVITDSADIPEVNASVPRKHKPHYPDGSDANRRISALKVSDKKSKDNTEKDTNPFSPPKQNILKESDF